MDLSFISPVAYELGLQMGGAAALSRSGNTEINPTALQFVKGYKSGYWQNLKLKRFIFPFILFVLFFWAIFQKIKRK